jgi:DNA-binding transcriptional LysR family regulator
MEIEHRSLLYAVTLAQYGNFARAAKALELSQPALSRAIQALEAALGARLFDRHPKGVTTTLVGEAFVARARAILDEVSSLGRIARDLSKGDVGRLVIGAGPFQLHRLLTPALRELVRKRVRLDVQVHVRAAATLIEMLRGDEIEFFVGTGEGSIGQPDLSSVELAAQPLVLYVRPGHPILANAPVDWTTVFAHLVAVATGADVRMNWLRKKRRETAAAASVVFADDLELLRDLVESCDAIGSEPASLVAPLIEAGRFAELPLADPLEPLAPRIVWYRDRPLSPPAQALVDAIVRIGRSAR